MSLSFLARCYEKARVPFSLLGSVRTATKRAGGTVRNHGGSPGKRLGLKKFSDQLVIPGNIIVRQRGTQFHPGQNVRMGRDHTIYATTPGFVRFYKQKWLRGDRKFIGVVLHRGEKLPRDETALGRSRFFGLVDLSAQTSAHGFKGFELSSLAASITMSYQLSIQPVRPADIPPEATIIDLGRQVLESTKSWKVGKIYAKGNVQTLSRAKGLGDGASWHCRVSQHTNDDATFDEFWSKLGVNKAENEKEFISAIKKVALVKQISDTQSIWTLYYTFPPPVSPRVFTVLQTVNLDESSPRTGMIISIPVDLSGPGDEELAKFEEKGIKGRYVSVERLLELDDGKVDWLMATSSTPGGRIPNFISESSIPGQISADVPHFMKWNHTTRNQGTV